MAIPTTADYLDRILQKSLEENGRYRYDADLTEDLGVSASAISNYRHGYPMTPLIAVKIAEILRIHPMEVISAAMSARAKNDAEKQIWAHYYQTYKS
jgi:hypothetical protein